MSDIRTRCAGDLRDTDRQEVYVVLLEGILAGTVGDDEQLRALCRMLDIEIKTPADAFVIGEPIEVVSIDYDGNTRRGLTATCLRREGGVYVVSAADLMLPENAAGSHLVAIYRMWLGIEAVPAPQPVQDRRPKRHKATEADLDISTPFELIVLAPKENAARCRILGTEREITLRSKDVWNMVPGEIATVRARKQWRYAGHPYISGDVENNCLDLGKLGLVPLKLRDKWPWDPAGEYWGEEGEPIEEWARPIIARDPRPSFEMEQVLPGEDPEDWDSDPIIEASELHAAGD